MNLTMMKFMSKIAIFQTLNCQDQLTITQKNFYLVFHFCIFKFATSLSADDQFSWLLFHNIPEKGICQLIIRCLLLSKNCLFIFEFLIGDVPTKMNKKSLESLLFQNGGIKNPSCFSIYKSTCTKLQRCLDGLINSPLLIINLFLNTHEDKVLESKFQNPGKVKNVAKLLQSILSVDWNSWSDQKNVQNTLNEAKTYLDLMNKIFPQPILEDKLL